MCAVHPRLRRSCDRGELIGCRTMPSNEIPDFDSALSQFSRFLANSGFSQEVLWVWREDVIVKGRSMHVRVPLPDRNRACAEARYAVGRELGYGVCLQMFALLDSKPCCFVRFASSEREAGDTFTSGLTFKLSSPPLIARPVRSRVLWWVLSACSRWAGHNVQRRSAGSDQGLDPLVCPSGFRGNLSCAWDRPWRPPVPSPHEPHGQVRKND